MENTKFIYTVNSDLDDELLYAEFDDETTAIAYAMKYLDKLPFVDKVELAYDAEGIEDALSYETIWDHTMAVAEATQSEEDYWNEMAAAYEEEQNAKYDLGDTTWFESMDNLVEDMEEKETEVECKECFELFPKVDCVKLDIGYLCPTCAEAGKLIMVSDEDTFKADFPEYEKFSNTTDDFDDSKLAMSDEDVVRVNEPFEEPEIENDPISTPEEAVPFLVNDEVEAVAGYEKAAEVVADSDLENKEEILDTIDHIKEEEEEHIEELQDLVDTEEDEIVEVENNPISDEVKEVEAPVETEEELVEHINDRTEPIESNQKLSGTDNAVVDCKVADVITHSEDEKPLNCDMKDKPLEKPLTEKLDTTHGYSHIKEVTTLVHTAVDKYTKDNRVATRPDGTSFYVLGDKATSDPEKMKKLIIDTLASEGYDPEVVQYVEKGTLYGYVVDKIRMTARMTMSYSQEKDADLVEEGFIGVLNNETEQDLAEFTKLCKEIGIVTVKDLDLFTKETVNEPGTILDKLRNYRKELGDDFQIKESLYNFTEEEMKEFNMDEDGNSLDSYDEYVRCNWCGEVFTVDQCVFEANMGWLCDRCEAAIRSRGEKLTILTNPTDDEIVSTLTEAKKMSRDELLDKEGTDDVELINAGREEEDRVELEESKITISRAEMAKLDKEVEEAGKEVAKYNIPMKAQKTSAGTTENVPDFDVVPEDKRDDAKKAYDRYTKALEARPDRAKNIIEYTD